MSKEKLVVKTWVSLVTVATIAISTASVGQSVLPTSKQEIENQYVQERQAGATNPAPRDPGTPLPLVQDAPEARGIIDDPDGPFPAARILISNRWQGLVNGVETSIYAGLQPRENALGQGIVIALSDFPTGSEAKTIFPPIEVGRLHIIADQNGQLIMVSNDGTYVFSFRTDQGAFTSSTTNVRRGDLNGDGAIDVKDVQIAQAALNTKAFGANDPRDLNRDGKIDALDVRILTTLCSKSRCAP